MNHENTAVIPVSKLENDFYDWFERHKQKTQLASSHQYEIIFIGDSITHFFEGDSGYPGRGEEIWNGLFSDKKALNLGFGWDRTQNVLWRLENGEFTAQKPRLVVINIGTNNLTGTDNARTNTPAEIAEGIKAVCDLVHEKSPESKILLMGIFPRGEPGNPLWLNIIEINSTIANFAEKPHIEFLDIGENFLLADGSISRELIPELVHPVDKGYQVWADAISKYINE